MGVTFHHEEDDVRILKIVGILRKPEFDAVSRAEARQWGPQARLRLLVLGEDFAGWEQSEEWGDLSFFTEYGDRIEKIAIVADPKWETDMLMFAAAGLRRAPVKFFPWSQVASARAWLKE
jgi:hypothetical protein